MKKRFNLILALVLLVALLVSSSVSVFAESTRDLYPGTPEENAITLDLEGEPASANSLLANSGPEFRVISYLLTPLFNYDADNNIVPAAAESYEVSEDSLVYTIKIRDDIVWSNGTPVTANDYAFAWKTLMTPETGSEYSYFAYQLFKNGYSFYSGECDWEDVGVKVIDDYTLEITLANPTPYVLSLLSFGSLCPVNEAFYNEVGALNYFTSPETTISCGPYIMETWVHEANIVMVKNPDYFEADKVSLDKVNFNMYTQTTTRLNAFKGGEVDVIALTGDQATELKNEGFETVDFVNQHETHILFNCEDEYLCNVNLRKAISVCFSRSDFVKAVLKDASSPSNTFIPIPTAGFDGNSFAEACAAQIGTDGVVINPNADAELANEYLDKALEELGCTKEDLSEHLDIHCSDSDIDINKAAFIQEALRTVLGLECTVSSMTTKARYAEQDAGNFVMDIDTWGGDYNDPMTWYDIWATGSGINTGHFSNAEYDACIEDAMSNTDLEARQQDFIRCEQIIQEECPISPVYWRASSYAVSGKITGGYSLSTWQNNFKFATVK